MSKLLKKEFIITLIALSLLVPIFSYAQEKTTVYLFGSDSCPHCAAEKAFLEKLTQEDNNVDFQYFEISKNKENAKLLSEISEKLSIDIQKIPITIIGDKHFAGYLNDETTGELIKKIIKDFEVSEYTDIVSTIIKGEAPEPNQNTTQEIPEEISIPFLGNVKIKSLSLPVLTIAIGAIDGFNPCAMWVLIFLISLLIGMKNRKRMWVLGATFIVSSAMVYFLFLTAWLNLFLSIGFISFIRILIALVAIGSGTYYLKKYTKDKADVCIVEDNKKHQKIIERLKNITQNKKLYISLIGIALLAVTVNIVELVCSAGLPAIYTNVLTMSELPTLHYYLYILLYILVFMLDDMIIFVVAMVTLRTIGLTKKYSRLSALVGGILM
ncbi:MAG: hypothetical protein K9M15_00670, partial [Candidatus Marinimicrobia bacterium]|nr:hypothetical protein [Candidatus Neomarinimicrobiota bacterium]